MAPNIKRISFTLIIALSTIGFISAKKVFITGDSHVFANYYPEKIEEILKSQHADVDCARWAKNGICFYSFNTHPQFFDSIFSFSPDILIVHLGTNGAYANNFTRRAFREEMEKFYSTLTDTLPQVKVVFVTPFTNKKRKYRKKGPWRINYRNREVADEIVAFVEDHRETFVVDNNKEAGMMFLKNPALIRPDNVHLTEAGYKILGEQVGEKVLEIDALWSEPENNIAD